MPNDNELHARAAARSAYHSNPNHVRDCATYGDYHGRECPCESDWRDYVIDDSSFAFAVNAAERLKLIHVLRAERAACARVGAQRDHNLCAAMLARLEVGL